MKTVDETADGYAELSDWIKEASTRMASSKEEIAGVMEVSGQLGVTGVRNLESFTETMVMLGDTTNLTAEEAATNIARLMNITGDATDTVDRVGSAIVALGNNFPTTEAEIVEMSTRLAAAGTIAGLTTTDILGLATAMSSVNINAEAGGTAMTQTLTGISKAVSEGGDKLEQLASVSGMSAQEFASTWNNEPIKALQAFIGGLSQMNDAELDTYTVLDELDMSGIRQSNMLQSLALASDTLTDSINTANTAYQENTALTDEAAKRYENFNSKMIQVKQSLGNVAIDIGERLAPYIEQLLAKVEEWIDKWDALDSGTQDMIVKIGLVVAAIGPVLSTVTRVTSSIGTITTVGGQLLTHLGMFAGFISSTIVPLVTGTIIPMIGTLATFITGTLLPALATIIVPLLPFIAIAAAVVAAGVLIYKNWDLIKEKAGELKDWLTEKFTAIHDGIIEKWTAITEGITMAWETIKTNVTGALDGMKAKIEENGGGIQGIFVTQMELFNQIWSDAFNLINEATGGKLGEVVNTISGKLDEIGNFFTELKDSALAWGQDLIQNFINGVLAKWEELKTTVSNVAQSVKDFLGFSEPKKGPLSNFHTYVPDMMKLYAEGIENSKYLVQNAVADVARDVSMLGNPGLDSDSIYSAVRQGSEDANISLSIGDREFQRYLRNIGVVFNA
jgi:TP901 family phage tail tape measure protein